MAHATFLSTDRNSWIGLSIPFPAEGPTRHAFETVGRVTGNSVHLDAVLVVEGEIAAGYGVAGEAGQGIFLSGTEQFLGTGDIG